MSDIICSHCGERNARDESYCRNCGALLHPPADPEPDPSPPASETTPDAPEPDVPDLPLPSAPETRDDKTGEEPSVGIGQLAGLIPERSELQRFLYQERDDPPPTPQDTDSVPLALSPLTLEATSPGFRLTGHMAGMTLRRQHMLFWLLGLAALIPFWLSTADSARSPQVWEGIEEARLILETLEPGSSVLVYWQNEPGVAGELDLASDPVLRYLLSTGIDIHVLSQHPLGLPQFGTLLDTIRADLQSSIVLNIDPESPETAVHTIGFWPGGYVVLPHMGSWLRSASPDLQLLVTPHVADILHWLELVAPFIDAPVVVITSAGTGQVIRPYLDTGQVAGLISGYDGAFQFTAGNGWPVPATYGPRMERHFAAQNWITACLILVILITLLFRDPPVMPWTSPHD